MTGRFGELLLILLIILVLFGAGKLPRVMSEIGRGIKAFKSSLSNKSEDDNENNKN
ncbi:MAG: twin-arginine translocase TatA/TatE family subunit [Candidatus Midichloria sp.]|nr:MAG: twin-arginine translocase TatA/TatE family subunit [Candidatus Midichloria sp.]